MSSRASLALESAGLQEIRPNTGDRPHRACVPDLRSFSERYDPTTRLAGLFIAAVSMLAQSVDSPTTRALASSTMRFKAAVEVAAMMNP
jgi:hypothetical protein